MEHANFFDRARPTDDTQSLSLGQYRLLDELGRGGMGRVYKALHTIMDRVVAIKVISPELVRDPLAVEWFHREVRACTHLAHPNIVMAFDANEAEGLHFLVMEYVEGGTLDALVKQYGPLPIDYACALMRQAALGLQHAHEKGLVHRDIKPSNLLIPLEGGGWRVEGGGRRENPLLPPPSTLHPPRGEVLVKILDFGLARLHGKTKDDTIALRGEAGVLGTPDYIAPEQSRNIHAADIRSDLYSLGCTFYFMLAGHVPFPGDNAMEKLVKHLTEQPEPLENVRPDVPPALAAIVRRLMAKDPADRYQTPAELARELEKVPGTFSEKVPDTFSSPKVVPTTRTTNRPLWITPPTQTPADRPPTDPQPESTCFLKDVDVFAPSRREAESSGPSLLEPLGPLPAGDSRHAQTHDTLTLSRAEDTEEVTTESLAAKKNRPPLPPPVDTDSTLPEMAAAGIGAKPATAPPDEPLPPIDPVVFRLWQRWTALVQTIVAGRGPAYVRGDHYRTIHALLLQACRAAIDACPLAERRAFYEECLSIAQPWLKPQTFVNSEQTMLNSLLSRCRQIEIELNGGKAPWTIGQCLGLTLLIFSPAAAALWYWTVGRLWLPALLKMIGGGFSSSSLRLMRSFLHAHPSLLIGVIFPLILVLSIVLLMRTPRT